MRRLHTLFDGIGFLLKIDVERGSSHLFLVRDDCGVVGADDHSEGYKVGCLPALLQEDGKSKECSPSRVGDVALPRSWSDLQSKERRD